MIANIEELVSLVPPPKTPIELPSGDDWIRAEVALGFIFPEDLKEIVGRYGSGFFGDFLVLLNPAASRRFMSVTGFNTDLGLTLEIFREIGDRDEDTARLVAFGYIINGDELFFGVSGPARSSIILYASRAGAFELMHRQR